ncbi:tyrosine-type recombinase/integrase [Algoriphagus taiwanensis]|uniref:Site-specific integrase n=1 Tax=Algoriphagus taiwanensis TaxID=1445656 RepID=A0ABQ6Q2N2_9BACT|nr:site-specific integrase [Algoriphagus taiwanensis]
MEKIVLYLPRQKSGRFKVYIPYSLKAEREAFKKLNTSFYHASQKLWSLVNTPENIKNVKVLFGEKLIEETSENREYAQPKFSLSEKSEEALRQLRQKLTLKAYSPSTLGNYATAFAKFLRFFEQRELTSITKEEIEGFVYHQINKYKISESAQNSLINAIKAYYEHVLGKPREYYEIQRPKASQTLPNILSKEEIAGIIQATSNLKHKTILLTIYSAGLRISEAVRLRIRDVHSDEGYLFIKGSKNKKDRKTVLSPILLGELRRYYRQYKPSYWLFEGQEGGQYSVKSIQNIFRVAVQKSGANPWATVHTLRHSFATHLLQSGTNLRMIQVLLGHASSKTTEIYSHVLAVSNKNVVSPLDQITELINLTSETARKSSSYIRDIHETAR